VFKPKYRKGEQLTVISNLCYQALSWSKTKTTDGYDLVGMNGGDTGPAFLDLVRQSVRYPFIALLLHV
jgi:hypothetical protein